MFKIVFSRVFILLFVFIIINNLYSAVQFQSPTDNPYTKICDGIATQEFSSTHKGIDIWNGLGWPIRAAENGKVIFVGTVSGYGCTVVLEHADGYFTRYAHLQADPDNKTMPLDAPVSGTAIIKGQIIGHQGNTGKVKGATGIHLHFEIRTGWEYGTAKDPRSFITKCLPNNGKSKKRGGPGGDQPDETYDFEDESFPDVSTENKTYMINNYIGVLNEGYSLSSSIMICSNWHAISLVEANNIVPLLLEDNCRILFIPTGGLYGLSDSLFFKSQLEEYVKSGGVIVCFAQQHGYDYKVLPKGEELGAFGWLEDMSCQNASVHIDVDSPIFAGQTRVEPNVNVDGYFSKWPTDGVVLLTRTKNGYPAMIEYPYGNGKVIISSMYTDWAYGHSQASVEEINLVRDLISYSKNIHKSIPTIYPGESVNVNLSVNYAVVEYVQPVATKVKFIIIDPDRNIVATEERVISLNPGSSQAFTVSYNSLAESKRGIWWIDYILYDSSGNIVQTEMEGERFAIQVPVATAYLPKDFQFWAVSSDDYVTRGSKIVLTINVKNNTDVDIVNANIGIGAHQSIGEGGEFWKYLHTIPNVTIPAKGERSFIYECTINISTMFMIGLFTGNVPSDMGGFRLAAKLYTEKGVWVVPPEVLTTVSLDKSIYTKGETVTGLLKLENLQSASYDVIANLRVVDINNVEIFSQSYNIFLPGKGSKTEQINFTLPENILNGIYIVKVEVLKDSNKVGTATAIFNVEGIKLGIIPIIPETFLSNALNRVIFQITNKGIGGADNVSLKITLKDPYGISLWTETKNFSISTGETINLTSDIPIGNILFGNYYINYEVDNIYGSKIISDNTAINLSLDKVFYGALDTINIGVSLTNTGLFIQSFKAICEIKDINYSEERVVTLNPSQSLNLAFSTILPNIISAGVHDIIIKLIMDGSGSTITKVFNFTVPESKLIASLDVIDYSAGDTVNVTVKNIGAIDTTSVYSLSLVDDRNKVIYSVLNIDLGEVKRGEIKNVSFNIPNNAKEGKYILTVELKNNRTNEITLLTKEITVLGLKVSMKSYTDKEVYLATENIISTTSITNLGPIISNANLNLKVKTGTGEERWDRFLTGASVSAVGVDDKFVWNGGWNWGGDGKNYLYGYKKDTNTWLTLGPYPSTIQSIVVEGVYLWIGTANSGLYRYNKEDGTTVQYTTANSGLSENNIISMCIYKGDLWIATYHNGINKFNRAENIWKTYTTSHGLVTNNISSIATDGIEIWAVTGIDGYGTVISKYDENLDKWISFTNYSFSATGHSEISLSVTNGYVYVGAEGGWLLGFDKLNQTWKSWQVFYGVYGEEARTITSLVEDGTGLWCSPVQVNKIAYFDKITETWRKYTLPAGTSPHTGVLDGNQLWIGMSNGVMRYTKPGGPGVTVWESNVSVNVALNEIKNINTTIGKLGMTGKFYLESTLNSNLAQQLAKDSYPFYVVTGNVALTLKTDKSIYKPNEIITITGEVQNKGTVNLTNLNLIIKKDNTIIHSEIFNLNAGEVHPFIITTTSTTSFSLNGSVSDVIVGDYIAIESPKVSMTVDAPSIVGRSPFDMNVKLQNTGNVDVNLNLTIAGELEPPLTLLAGQSMLVKKTLTITQDTVVDIVLSGDVSQTIQKQVIFGENAKVNIIAEKVYPEGTISIPYSIVNTGSLDTQFDTLFSLKLNGQEIYSDTKNYYIPVSQSVNGILQYNLNIGNYSLNYTTPFESNKVDFIVGKYNTASLNIQIGNSVSGVFPIKVVVANTGVNVFEGTLRIINKFLNVEQAINLNINESKEFNFNITALEEGTFGVSGELLYAGNVIAEDVKEINVKGPSFILTSIPQNLEFNSGANGSVVFNIKNVGDIEGQAKVHLTLLDAVDQTKFIWLKSEEEKSITFDFVLPDDLDEKDYISKLDLNGNIYEIPFHLKGVKLNVILSLDKSNYSEGEVAVVTFNINNLSSIIGIKMYGFVQYNGYSEKKDFVLNTGIQDVTFNIPVHFTNEEILLYCGVYFSSGRAVYLNTIRIYKKGDIISLYTDKQVYNLGEVVFITVDSTEDGLLEISGPNYNLITNINVGTSYFNFTLPERMVAGVYSINYIFKGISYRYNFEVAGYLVKVKEAILDKINPNPNEQVNLTLKVESSHNIDSVVLKGVLIDPLGNSSDIFEQSFNLVQGMNNIAQSFILNTTSGGMHKIVYSFTTVPDLPLVSAMKAFDVGRTVLVSLVSDKNIYNISEEVNIVVSALTFVERVSGNLKLYDSGNLIKEEIISFSGYSEFRYNLGRLSEGIHTVVAELVVNGLISSKQTSFEVKKLDIIPPMTTVSIGEPKYITAEKTYIASTTLITLTATDDISGIQYIEYSIQNTGYKRYIEPFVVPRTYPDGEIIIKYRSVDNAGNIEAEKSITLILDNTSPVSSIIIGQPQYDYKDGTPIVVSSRTQFTISAVDNLSGVKYTEYRIQDTEYKRYTEPFVIPITYSDGEIIIKYRSVDNVENIETTKSIAVTLDNTSPVVELLLPSSDLTGIEQNINGIISVIGTALDLHFDYYKLEYGAGENPVSWQLIKTSTSQVSEGELGKWDTTTLPEGTYTLRLVAVDKVGNVSIATAKVVIGLPKFLLAILDELSHPDKLAVDKSGYIYVADRENDCIKKFDHKGNYIKIGRDILSKPEGIDLDSEGNIYVGSRNTSVIEKFDSQGNYVATIGRYYLNKVCGIKVDENGDIVVADRNEDFVRIFRGDGSLKYTIGVEELNKPEDVFIYKDKRGDKYYYVANRNEDNIKIFNEYGGLVKAIDCGKLLLKPDGLLVTQNGLVIVADSNNSRVVKLDKYGNITLTINIAENKKFNHPKSVCFDSLGNLYVADSMNKRIVIFGNKLPDVSGLPVEEVKKVKKEKTNIEELEEALAKRDKEWKDRLEARDKELNDKIKEREEFWNKKKKERDDILDLPIKKREEARQKALKERWKHLEDKESKNQQENNSKGLVGVTTVIDSNTGEVIWDSSKSLLELHKGLEKLNAGIINQLNDNQGQEKNKQEDVEEGRGKSEDKGKDKSDKDHGKSDEEHGKGKKEKEDKGNNDNSGKKE